MLKCQCNNILFRIASSDAISKFKSTQAHAFLQLSRSDIAFDFGVKEVVLLEYDRISQWIYRVERMLLSSESSEIAKPLRHAITESFREEALTIENVIESHQDVFTKEVLEFTRLIHSYSCVSIIDKMEIDMQASTTERAFTHLVLLMTNYLQHLLLGMHEYNNNMITRRCAPFISFSDACIKIEPSDKALVPLMKRASFFKTKMLAKSFIFKDYSNEVFSFGVVLKALAPLGISLVDEPHTNGDCSGQYLPPLL